jgi:hypothetical protein
MVKFDLVVQAPPHILLLATKLLHVSQVLLLFFARIIHESEALLLLLHEVPSHEPLFFTKIVNAS